MTNKIDKGTQAIEQLLIKFEEAWNIHDAKAFAQIFAEDADFTNVFGWSFHGRTQIEAHHAPIFQTMFRNSTLTITGIKPRFLYPDIAAVDVHWQMSGATDSQGNPWPERKGLLNLIVKEEAENWAILIMHNKDLPVVASN